MPYRIAITRAAAKQVKALPSSARQRVRDAINGLADEPRPHGLKSIDSAKKLYRVRVGPYRVVYQIQDARLVVVVVRVGDRKEVYRRPRWIGEAAAAAVGQCPTSKPPRRALRGRTGRRIERSEGPQKRSGGL